MDHRELLGRLAWLGHDSFMLRGTPTICFDPWKLKGLDLPPADLVLVTHDHFDHCSPEDVALVSGPDTAVVAAPGAAAMLPGARALGPGEELTAAGIRIEAVPAYNLNKFRAPGQPFHPRPASHVGFVITVDGVRLYFAGDTDFIPEMRDISCQIAMLPVSGTYVMTMDEALQAAEALKPAVVVPMHYGDIVGDAEEGRRFARRYSGETLVLEPLRRG